MCNIVERPPFDNHQSSAQWKKRIPELQQEKPINTNCLNLASTLLNDDIDDYHLSYIIVNHFRKKTIQQGFSFSFTSKLIKN